jgi:IS5 family transposase
MLLVGMWNGLSDYGTEDIVNDSLSANRFCGLSIEDKVPDHSVLSRFRTHLTKKQVFDKLLTEVNKQLEQKQVMIKTVVKVDASITSTCNDPIPLDTFIA